jgi:hypothetical protein
LRVALDLGNLPLQLAEHVAGAREPEGVRLPWDLDRLVFMGP